jgi:serine protease
MLQVFPHAAHPEEYIVKLRTAAGAVSIQSQPGLSRKAGSGRLLLVKGAQARAMKSADRKEAVMKQLDALRALPDVEYAHPNYRLQAFELNPNDKCYAEGRQWSYPLIGLPRAWDRGTGSAATRVAVVDTGLAAKNDDFSQSNMVPGFNFVEGGPDVVDRGSFHGTHVAGTIGITRTNNEIGMAGINWSVGVQPVRVLDDTGSGSLFDIVQGIRWAAGLPVDGAPANPTPAKVINLSLGGQFRCTEAPALQEAIAEAFQAGSIVVAAAGNSAADAKDFSPAGCDKVVAAAAAGPEGDLAFYSNFGDVVAILAPGGDKGVPQDDRRGILSSVLDGFAYFQGTSMAAPHVSAVMALVASRDSTLTPQQVIDRVLAAATPLQAGQCPRPCGRGLLNGNVP